MVKSNREFSLGDRLRRGIAVGTLGTLGMTGLAACGPSVSAEKPPVTASSSATPGAAETPVVIETPAPQETSKPATEVVGGIDVSNLSPESRELAESLTPEKVAAMSAEEREKAFTIDLSDISGAKDPARAYVEKSFVLVASLYSAGATKADEEKFKNNDAPGYNEFNQTELLDPTISAIFNEGVNDASTLRDYAFAKRHYFGQKAVDGAHQLFPDDPDVAKLKDYSMVFSLDEKSIDVGMNGNGDTSSPISVKYAINFQEHNEFTPAQLNKLVETGENPAELGNVKGTISLMIEYVSTKINGTHGNKVEPDNLVAKMESNQNADGTVS